jgi:hypothetical protein
MILKFNKEHIYKNNDIYLLKNDNSAFIINNNYEGICWLDENLELEFCIDLFEDVVINQVFISSFFKENLILDCAENNCLVVINKDTKKFHRIENFYNITPVYQWEGETTIFSTSDKKFFSLHSKTGEITLLSSNMVERSHPSFFKLFVEYQAHISWMVDNQKYEIIFAKEDKSFWLLQLLFGKCSFLGFFLGDPIQIIKLDSFVFILTENNLHLLKDEKLSVLLSCKKDKRYHNITLMNNTTLAVLTTYEENQFLNCITLYDII